MVTVVSMTRAGILILSRNLVRCSCTADAGATRTISRVRRIACRHAVDGLVTSVSFPSSQAPARPTFPDGTITLSTDAVKNSSMAVAEVTQTDSRVIAHAKEAAKSPDMTPCVRQYTEATKSNRRGVFIPRCTGDGKYELQQCHGSVCFCVDESGNEEPGTRVSRGQKANCTVKMTLKASSMPCEVERSTKSSSDVTDHVPQCKKTGHYEEVQCSAWTGYCWCVDTNGTEMAGSRTREHLSCPSLGTKPSKCQLEYIKTLKEGQGVVPRCTEDGRYEAMQCRGLSCSCVNRDSGTVIPGTNVNTKIGYPQCQTPDGLTKCQRLQLDAMRKSAKYVPRCKMNGEFQETQCDAGTQECWCVDSSGDIISGSRTTSTITCPILGSSLTPCQKHYQNTLRRRYNPINQRAPRCKANGGFEEIQCHVRECHCVNEDGNEVNGTRIHAPGRQPNCTVPEVNTTPCERAQHSARSSDTFVPWCKPDGSWQEVQCEHSSGECWCVDGNGQEVKNTRTLQKPLCAIHGKALRAEVSGSCWSLYVSLLRASRKTGSLPWCTSDGHFNPMQCHGSFCYCVYDDGVEVPDTRISVAVGRPTCSKSGAGSLTRCQREYRRAVLYSMTNGYVPLCKQDGRFEEVQCRGDVSECWCVDHEGQELPGTRSTKLIKCPVIGGPLTECQREYQKYTRNASVAAHVAPRCSEDGTYEPMQCGTRFCYCVDLNGNEIPATRNKKHVGMPICTRDSKQRLTSCHQHIMRALQAPRNQRGHVPICKSDGRYEEVQCYGKECWCVDKHGQETPGTRTTGLITCPASVHVLSPCQQRYQSTLRSSLRPVHVPRCNQYGAYENVQCIKDSCFCVNNHGVELFGSRVQAADQLTCRGRGPTICERQMQIFRRMKKRGLREPLCNPDGSFYPVQCRGAQCYCVDNHGVEVAGSRQSYIKGHPVCTNQSTAVSSLTVCQQQVRYSIQSPLGGNAPRCKEDGRFEEIQCDHVTGFCWCVDDSGTIKEGTKTNGTIACGNANMNTRCWEEYVQSARSGRDGIFTPWCTPSGAYNHLQLQGSYYFCVNARGREILGTRVSVALGRPDCGGMVSARFIPSPCQRMQAKQVYAPLSLGSYIPACKPNGSFDNIQYESTYGQSWCVDSEGKEKKGMRTAGLIICPPNAPLSRCHQTRQSIFSAIEHAQSAPLFIPTCRDDGSFADVQCHGLTGNCWCVDMNGIEIPGSVTRGHRPDCKKAAQTTSCQRQRTAALGLTGRPNSARYLPQCKPTGRYEEVQCHTGTGLCWCVDERGQEITRTRTWGYPRCHMAPKRDVFPLDLAILIPSASTTTLPSIKAFLQSLVSHLEISRRNTHLSIVVFSTDVRAPLTFFNLPWNSDSERRVLDVIRSLSTDSTDARLDRGLKYVEDEIFAESSGERTDSQKALFVVMDKAHPLDQDGIVSLGVATRGLRNRGVLIATVGVGLDARIEDLLTVASDPYHVFTARGYDELPENGQVMAEVIKNATRDVRRVEEQCNQANDVGQLGCQASIPAWHYDSVTGRCLQFRFSGCGGNANNFPNHELCRRKCGGVLPLCLAERRRRAQLVLGHFTPNCTSSGRYEHMQCYGTSGTCWCVDTHGRERPGTRVKGGFLVCNQVKAQLSLCLKERRRALGLSSVPTHGRHVPDCLPNGEYAQSQTIGNSNFFWCVDAFGATIPRSQRWGRAACATASAWECPKKCPDAKISVECSSDKDCAAGFKCCSCGGGKRCTSRRSPISAPMSCEFERQQAMSNSLLNFVPKCAKDGSYKHAQCLGNVCWCVDRHGNERPGTRSIGSVKCESRATISPCQREAAHARSARRLSGFPFFVSQCQPDGGFTPLQCHSATGFCWCVDGNGNELAGTRVWGRNNCTEINETMTMCQYRRLACERHDKGVECLPSCTSDGSYKELQCIRDECWCVDKYGYERQATRMIGRKHDSCGLLAWLTPCQIQRRSALGLDGIPVVGRFFPECKADGSFTSLQCDPAKRVCWCVTSRGIEVPGTRGMPGERPYCGKENLCEERRAHALSTTNRSLECLPDGSFKPRQCDGELCWCVNKYGNALFGTISPNRTASCTGQGLPICHYRYNIAMQQGSLYAPSCRPDGSYSPKQCDARTGECWCSDRNGQESAGSRRKGNVHCDMRDDLCFLPLQRGPCKEFLPQWYFNASSGACEIFLYSGCDGNNNNFETYDKCFATCNGKSLTLCQQQYQQSKFLLNSRFLPKCKEDGSYASVQCFHGDLECWCVDKDGEEIRGTHTFVGPPLDCNERGKETSVGGRVHL
ncbi:thyroglobulin isoform X2 [Nematostella vectensis]|uniref:thyroglobulin isoform X2 n=1 Tax=Nematostella vectensis TaxID=45351 RepID=UPI0020770A15|nr:thyroglobulin isoform X2 [Nematostella vectensis]